MEEEFATLLSMRWRDAVRQVMYLGVFISMALVSWRCLAIVTNCEASVVVVLSGSMEPGYERGDVLFLHHRPQYPVKVGDVIVYQIGGKPVPIVHRVHRIHERAADGKRLLLTKGDNNVYDDRNLYPVGQDWIEESMIMGKTYAYVPRIGYVTILFNESKIFKYLALAVVGFFVLTSNED